MLAREKTSPRLCVCDLLSVFFLSNWQSHEESIFFLLNGNLIPKKTIENLEIALLIYLIS
jgi:hypothetical protein